MVLRALLALSAGLKLSVFICSKRGCGLMTKGATQIVVYDK